MENENLFGQTYSQLAAQFGAQAKNFQLIANPMNFNWPIVDMGQESLNAYQLMSMSPKWSPVGTFTPGDSTFFSSYQSVLLSAVTFKVSPEKQHDLDVLHDAMTQERNHLMQISSDAATAYAVAKQNGGEAFIALYPSINDWYNGEGSTYKQEIQKQTAVVNKKIADLAVFSDAIGLDPRLKQDLDLIKVPTDVSASPPRGWTKVRNTDGSLSWEPLFNIATTGQEWRRQLTTGSQGQFTVHLDASNQSKQMDHSWAGPSYSYDGSFWGIGRSGAWDRIDQIEKDSSLTVDISVQSSTWVPVTPGDWYDSGLMRQLARNIDGSGLRLVSPWVVQGGPGSKAIFGQNGLLATRVSGLAVVYKPAYSINMQASTYESFHQKIANGYGLRIGPFTFGRTDASETTSYKASGNRVTLTSQSNCDDPLIIGLTVAFPGLDEP